MQISTLRTHAARPVLATFRNILPLRAGLTLASLPMTSDLGGVAARYLELAGAVVSRTEGTAGPVLPPRSDTSGSAGRASYVQGVSRARDASYTHPG